MPALVIAVIPPAARVERADEQPGRVAVDRRQRVIGRAGDDVDEGVLTVAGLRGRAADGDRALRLVVAEDGVLARVDGVAAPDGEGVERLRVGRVGGLRRRRHGDGGDERDGDDGCCADPPPRPSGGDRHGVSSVGGDSADRSTGIPPGQSSTWARPGEPWAKNAIAALDESRLI
ncbi:hypothetical protein PUW81_003445 [Microbacterium sp. NM3R9]|nr:hypothetical protein [Microbacterium thalli]MDN8548155.1 hypothetical protein [Microbacterium thalli]